MRPNLHCLSCDHRFRLPLSAVEGEEVICPSCGAQVRAPADDLEAARNEDEPRRDRSPRPKSGGRLLMGLLLGCGTLVLLCGGGIVAAVWWFLAPTSFPEQTEDYVQARQHFRTKLLQHGPAPQPWQKDRPPRSVSEKAYKSGNLQLMAWVNEPPLGEAGDGRARKPAVLYLHCGFAFGADDWEEAKPFRDAGFVVLIPMLRGENGLPGSYSMFYDEVDDVLAAADALARLPYVDDTRLYVAGRMEGGTLALLAAMTTKRFRAAASLSGSPDQVLWSRGKEHWLPFDPDDQREFQVRSPLAYPRSFKCPVRLYHGAHEPLSLLTSPRLAQKAQAADLDVEAIEVSGDEATSLFPAMRQCIQFFQQH